MVTCQSHNLKLVGSIPASGILYVLRFINIYFNITFNRYFVNDNFFDNRFEGIKIN